MTITVQDIKRTIRDAEGGTREQLKLFDDRGLFLLAKRSGSAGWRLKFRLNGREKLVSLGRWPDVTLAMARDRRDESLRKIADGINPADERREVRAAAQHTFAVVAEDYIQAQEHRLAKRTTDKSRWQLREFINPHLGGKPINEITAQQLLAVLRRIESRGKIETAHKTKELCGRVFMYGIATGVCERNVAADLKLALKPRAVENLAALTNPVKVGALLRAIDGFDGMPATHGALQLMPHVFLRPGELRAGQWSEVNFKTAQWVIPGARMKMRRDHIVPLSHQAIAILKAVKQVTGHEKWVFPAIGGKDRCLSDGTLGAALRAIGYPSNVHTPHGFRTTASTLLHDMGYPSMDIELQLAHADKNKIRATYNRAERLKERTAMMQKWSDHLDELRAAKP